MMDPIPKLQPNRTISTVVSPPKDTPSFLITATNRSYKHQYANIYFARLRLLRKYVEENARKRWQRVEGSPQLITRVLEVTKGQICYVVGTVYMDMPLKPNILVDIARDRSIPPLPPPKKIYSSDDSVMLEDESGRIKLVGEPLNNAQLVTGVILGVLGVETPNGEFEVVDLCYPGLPPQISNREQTEDEKMDIDGTGSDTWVAVLSGLDIGSPNCPDVQVQMLVEYLAGEAGHTEDQVSASQISRLIIAGSSLAPLEVKEKESPPEGKRSRRYGDQTTFSDTPIKTLNACLLEFAQIMPVHILPGPGDPAGSILPQQPFPRAMFGAATSYPSFSCETNPTFLRISAEPQPSPTSKSTRTLLINSGQPLDDMFKYLPSPPHTRLALLEATLKWRHIAPTAPDTLWCHPYFTTEPFILNETPDIYIVGGQKRFGTKMIMDDSDKHNKKRCRIIMVPRFAETGILVLVNLRTLDIRAVNFAVMGMTSGGGKSEKGEQDTETQSQVMSIKEESQVSGSIPDSQLIDSQGG